MPFNWDILGLMQNEEYYEKIQLYVHYWAHDALALGLTWQSPNVDSDNNACQYSEFIYCTYTFSVLSPLQNLSLQLTLRDFNGVTY